MTKFLYVKNFYEEKRKILSNIIGYFCICVFFSLTTYIIYIFYSIIAPTILNKKHYGKFIFHFIFGNWLLINIYFNYIMAWLTSPGLAKNYQHLSMQYPICRKCLLMKPPRAHHCSWCDLCILKYDHHCPWLNNCVGFYNHRYFFQFCCFMSAGCLYAGLFGYYEYQISQFGVQLFGYKDSIFMITNILEVMGVGGFITYYIFIIALVIGCLLFVLSLSQGRLISKNETTIESLIQEDSSRPYSEHEFLFVNMYDLKPMENWKRFFGVRTINEFIRRILLPSRHKPKGNAIIMDDYDGIDINLYRRQTTLNNINSRRQRKISFTHWTDIMQDC